MKNADERSGGDESRGEQLRLNLLENGLDFVREGVEALYGGGHALPPKPSTYKYALLHVFSGVLLVLKERLRRAHDSLIFRKVEQCGTRGARTVDFDDVIDWLDGAAGVKIASADQTLLRGAQKMRNQLEHFEANLNLDDVQARVGEMVDFLERFLHDELEESLFHHVSAATEIRLSELRGIAERLRERRHAEWRSRIGPYLEITPEDLEKLADEKGSYHPKHNPQGGYYSCPECREATVVVAGLDIGVCTRWQCREVHRLGECELCWGVTFSDENFCEGCASRIRYQLEHD